MMRVGQGYDCHRFIDGDFIMLGGVKVPHTHAVDAHSDGDVILHAIVDALLGAAVLGDIGELFSDEDPAYANQSSTFFLLEVATQLKALGYALQNIDVTVITERPKLKPFKLVIQENIANLLKIDQSQVSIKAKTNEKLGFVGREEGIAAMAVVLIEGK